MGLTWSVQWGLDVDYVPVEGIMSEGRGMDENRVYLRAEGSFMWQELRGYERSGFIKTRSPTIVE